MLIIQNNCKGCSNAYPRYNPPFSPHFQPFAQSSLVLTSESIEVICCCFYSLFFSFHIELKLDFFRPNDGSYKSFLSIPSQRNQQIPLKTLFNLNRGCLNIFLFWVSVISLYLYFLSLLISMKFWFDVTISLK